MSVKRPIYMTCRCGSKVYSIGVNVIQQPGGGITTKTVGYICQVCQEPLNVERNQKLQELEQKRRELEEVTQELEIYQDN